MGACNGAGRGSCTPSRFSWIGQALICNANLSSGLEVSQLGPQKRHPAPHAWKQHEWIVHKHLRKGIKYCFNAHFQPKQDTHVDFDTCRCLQDLQIVARILCHLRLGPTIVWMELQIHLYFSNISTGIYIFRKNLSTVKYTNVSSGKFPPIWRFQLYKHTSVNLLTAY